MRLFLYGTLMGHADTPMARWLGQRVRTGVTAVAAGRMLAVPSPTGWFPAMVPGTGRVTGILADTDLGPGDLARLDRYEGREYRRMAIRVRAGREMATAQAWIWRAGLPKGARSVASGDFLDWLDESGSVILSSRNGI